MNHNRSFSYHFPRNIMAAGVALGILAVLAACAPDNSTPPEEVYTQQAKTLIAVLTDAVLPTEMKDVTVGPAATDAAQPAASNTPLASGNTQAASPTNTLPMLPSATATSIPCLRADFISDVTIPDNTKVNAGSTFKKTWKVRNSGSCAWTGDFMLALFAGERMGGKDDTLGVNVPPGTQLDISVWLIAPDDTSKPHRGDWKLRNPQGTWFGVGLTGGDSLYVLIQVLSVTPTVTLTPSQTPTPLNTNTPTNTPTPAISPTPTRTPTPTPTPTPTVGAYPR
jgi:hypothetical protein